MKTSTFLGKPAFSWKKKKKTPTKKKHFPGKISVFLGKQTISHYGNSIDPDHYVHTVSQGSQTLHTEGFNLDHSLGKFSRWQIDIFFLFFSENRLWHSCKLTICMKCQSLIAEEKIRKKFQNDICCSWDFLNQNKHWLLFSKLYKYCYYNFRWTSL